jgi:hypothetical protein
VSTLSSTTEVYRHETSVLKKNSGCDGEGEEGELRTNTDDEKGEKTMDKEMEISASTCFNACPCT